MSKALIEKACNGYYETSDGYLSDVLESLARHAPLYDEGNGKIGFDSPFFPNIGITGFDTVGEARAKYLSILQGGRDAHKQRLIAAGAIL